MPCGERVVRVSVRDRTGRPRGPSDEGPGQPAGHETGGETGHGPDPWLEHLRGLGPSAGGPRAGEGLVVGLSGGADSVALLDLLHRLAPERGLRLVAAHLDHGLRPDSAEDAAFCARACRERDVPFHGIRADVAARARRSGAGVEAAGRHARAAWFEAVRRREGLDRIATGHHLDDHVETVALSVLRGAGLRGLSGIAPSRDRWIRPLRAFTREDLRAYLAARGLPWREDPSNAETELRRNLLRHEILPGIDTLTGGVDWRRRIADLSRRAHAERQALHELVADRLEHHLRERAPGRLALDRAGFGRESEVVRFQLLREAIGRIQPPTAHQRWNEERWSDVLHFVETAAAGKRWPLPQGGWVETTRELVILSSPSVEEENDRSVAWASPGALRLRSQLLPAPAPGFSFQEPDAAWFDAARVRPPFTLRTIRPGDRMQPFGMAGRKKLATLLGERAVPRNRRAHQLVVSDADRILWAVGLTTCHRARVRAGTDRVWRLHLEYRTDEPVPPEDPTP